MRLLLLGGAGFVGTNLVRDCMEWGFIENITVVDSLDPRLKSTVGNLPLGDKRVTFLKGDIRDRVLMENLVARHDVVINCAAQTSHPYSLQDPLGDVEVNVLGSLTLLEAIRNVNPDARFISISTSTVIGRARTQTITEEHGEWALDIYSSNKAAAEKHCFIYAQVHGLKVLTLRFANLYGPFGKGYPEFGFINYFISLARSGQEIPVFGPGGQLRNVMYVRDAVTCIRHCLDFMPVFDGTPYFAVHDEHMNVMDIAKGIVSTFEHGRVVVREWPEERARIEIGPVTISGEKLYKATGWQPRYLFTEGMRETREIIGEINEPVSNPG